MLCPRPMRSSGPTFQDMSLGLLSTVLLLPFAKLASSPDLLVVSRSCLQIFTLLQSHSLPVKQRRRKNENTWATVTFALRCPLGFLKNTGSSGMVYTVSTNPCLGIYCQAQDPDWHFLFPWLKFSCIILFIRLLFNQQRRPGLSDAASGLYASTSPGLSDVRCGRSAVCLHNSLSGELTMMEGYVEV